MYFYKEKCLKQKKKKKISVYYNLKYSNTLRLFRDKALGSFCAACGSFLSCTMCWFDQLVSRNMESQRSKGKHPRTLTHYMLQIWFCNSGSWAVIEQVTSKKNSMILKNYICIIFIILLNCLCKSSLKSPIFKLGWVLVVVFYFYFLMLNCMSSSYIFHNNPLSNKSLQIHAPMQ